MQGSAKYYLERTGLRPTFRAGHRPRLAPGLNVVIRTPAVILPDHLRSLTGDGSPDRAGRTEVWPNEEVLSVP